MLPTCFPPPIGPPLLGKQNGAHLSGRVRWELGLVGKRERDIGRKMEKTKLTGVKGASRSF